MLYNDRRPVSGHAEFYALQSSMTRNGYVPSPEEVRAKARELGYEEHEKEESCYA